MSWWDAVDIVSALLMVAGAIFCLAAAVGIVRFPDVMTRLHAATKPQVFGLVLILTGAALISRSWHVAALAFLTVVFQILTAPVSGHMVARTAYRTDQWDSDHATVDELGRDLEAAGFRNTADADDQAS